MKDLLLLIFAEAPRFHRNLTALFLSGTICNMCQNLKQPGFQTVLTAKITDVQICRYKGLLKNVLRILTVSQNQ